MSSEASERRQTQRNTYCVLLFLKRQTVGTENKSVARVELKERELLFCILIKDVVIQLYIVIKLVELCT